MHGGECMVPGYPFCKSFPFESSAEHVAPQDVSATGVYLKKYTTRSATG